MKKPIDQEFEAQIHATPCTFADNSMICMQARNWEVRLSEEQSQFVPNAKNFAPRAKNWKVGRNSNYYGNN